MSNVGTNLYFMGGTNNNYANYKYNTITGVLTQEANMPLGKGYMASIISVGENIYIFGGYSDYSKMMMYHAQSKAYSTDNTVVIAQGRTYSIGYNIKLFETNFETDYQPLYGFADAWFYTLQDGLDGTMPVYYGDGTQWINIKNPPQNNGGEE